MGDRLFDASLTGPQSPQGAIRGGQVAAGKAGGQRRPAVGFGLGGPAKRVVTFAAAEVKDGATRFQGDGGVVMF